MGLFSWLIFGALSGWIASRLVGKNSSMGLFANIATGIVGSFVGGFIANNLFKLKGVTGFNLYSFLVAVMGAVILLKILNAVAKNKK